MRILSALLILPFLILVGCADSQKLDINDQFGAVSLDRNASAYIAIPANGRYGNQEYHGSGATVAQIIKGALSVHLVHVDIGTKVESFPKAKSSAALGHYKYLFYPTIVHWEDRATEWSAKADKVSVNIAVIDVESGEQISSASIDGQSGLATFGGDHPQDLLPEPITKYIAELF